MTKYLGSAPFSVGSAGTQQWRDSHDAIFRCKGQSEGYALTGDPRGVRCELKRNHAGSCQCGELTWDCEWD